MTEGTTTRGADATQGHGDEGAGVRPTFILGVPRSGTSLTLRILSSHREFSWLNQYHNRFPRIPSLSGMNRLYDELAKRFSVEVAIKARKKAESSKLLPHPVEPWQFWDTHLKNFRRSSRGITEAPSVEDISGDVRDMRRVGWKVVKGQRTGRLLSKYTDFPRIDLLTEVFPSANFIEVRRDPRASAYSLYRMNDRENWYGGQEEAWAEAWPEDWTERWRRADNPDLVFAANQVSYFRHHIDRELEGFTGDFQRLRYRDLTDEPTRTIEDILYRMGMAMDERIAAYIQETPIENRNEKWRDRLGKREKAELEGALHETNSDGSLEGEDPEGDRTW